MLFDQENPAISLFAHEFENEFENLNMDDYGILLKYQQFAGDYKLKIQRVRVPITIANVENRYENVRKKDHCVSTLHSSISSIESLESESH